MQNYLGNAKRENVEDLRGRGGGCVKFILYTN